MEPKKPTKERIEFNKELKKAQEYINELALKADMSEQGIDTSKVSRQTFDEIKRQHDSQSKIQAKYNAEISKVTQERQEQINKIQATLQAEIAAGVEALNKIMEDIKKEQGIVGEASTG
jgi:DNA anti-recombination protein RmuC